MSKDAKIDAEGCSHLLAHGFTIGDMVELVRAGLATARVKRTRALAREALVVWPSVILPGNHEMPLRPRD